MNNIQALTGRQTKVIYLYLSVFLCSQSTYYLKQNLVSMFLSKLSFLGLEMRATLRFYTQKYYF